MLDAETVLVFVLLGTFVGFAAGLFGIGGGGIMVPVLTTFFLKHNISNEQVMHLALGTSMMSIVATSFSSFRAHHAKKGVRWDIFYKMVFGVVLGTFLSTFIASSLSSFYLAIFFTVLMIFVAIRMALNIQPKHDTKEPSNFNLFWAGTIIGAISAMMSVGGGAYTVPYLTSHNIDIKKAIGTSAAIGFPIALSGTLGYMVNGWSETSISSLQIGYIYLPAVIIVSICSAFTAPYGVRAAHTLQSVTLKRLFALLLIGLSIKMLISIL